MEKRAFGKTGMEVSVLGFGGAEIGYEGVSDPDVASLLGGALDAGLNVIDTAECYVDSEEKIGRAVSHRRSDFYLFTKVGHPGGTGTEDWSIVGILQSIERSLTRLQTDHLDLVQLHSCSEDELRKGNVISALETARERGYTRFIGYSGDSQAAKYALETDRFDSLQTSINIADQEAWDLTLPLAREKGVGVIAKRPVANAAWRTGKQPANAYHHVYWDRLQELKYGFLSEPLEESVAVALRFALSAPAVSTAIVGTTKPGRWQDNAGIVAQGPLPAAMCEGIRARWKEIAKPEWTGET